MSMRALLFAGVAVTVLAIGGTLAFSPWTGPSLAQGAPTAAPPAADNRIVPQSDTQMRLSFAPVVKAGVALSGQRLCHPHRAAIGVPLCQ